MKKATFPGGIHPPDQKITGSKPIEKLAVPDRLIIPLVQHIGAPCNALVKVGDHVKTGQKIGEAGGFVSANVHSTGTGKVAAIGPFPHPVGRDVLSVVVETDEEEIWDEGTNQPCDWSQIGRMELKEAIQEAGIVGMGGAAFPSHVKLSPPKGKKIDTLLINGAECEPYLTADHRVMVERTNDVLVGAKILMRVLEVDRVFLGVEQNKPDAIQMMMDAAAEEPKIECVPLKTKYPQGGEKQLIKALTGREVPSGGLPMDCGCVVHNVGTAVAVMEAVCLKKPLIERVLTVTGNGVQEPKNLSVRIGTSFQEVLSACGLRDECDRLISGGPMMGIAQWSLQTPVVKSTSGLLCLTRSSDVLDASRPCISCGSCLQACPISLVPTLLAKNAERQRWSQMEEMNVLDCIECGSCTYVCPSKINLVHYLKWGKAEVAAMKKKERATAKASQA